MKKKDDVIEAEVENDCSGKIELARQSAIVKPVDVEGTLEAYRQFEEIKKKLLGDNDYMWFDENGKPAERNGGNPYIKKSGWRKIKTAFGVSIEYLNEGIRTEGEDAEGKYYVWRYRVRAITPNGIYQDADGAASSRKAFFSKKYGKRIDPEEEDIILTAQTVAINRAVSDLVGGGEVSAEEMIGKSISNPKTKAVSSGKPEGKFKSNREYWNEYDWSKVDLDKIPPSRGYDKIKNKPQSSMESLKLYYYACDLMPKENVNDYLKTIIDKKTYQYTYKDIQTIVNSLNEIEDETAEDIEEGYNEAEQEGLI